MIILEDVLICARTVYGEARGQPDESLRAVMHVIMNRCDKKIGDYDHSLAATALRWLQFSAWNEQDPNRLKMQEASVDDTTFRRCLRAVLEALDEPDFTNGARHYHTRAAPSSQRVWPPSWARGHQPCWQDDVHLFYNDVA